MDYLDMFASGENATSFMSVLKTLSNDEKKRFLLTSSLKDYDEYYIVNTYFSLPPNYFNLEEIVIYALNNGKEFKDIKEYLMTFLDASNFEEVIDIFNKYSSKEDMIELIGTLISMDFDFRKVINKISENKNVEDIKSSFTIDYVNELISSNYENIDDFVEFLEYQRFPSGRIINTIVTYPNAKEFIGGNILSSDDDVLVPDQYIGTILDITEDIYLPVIRYEILGGGYYHGKSLTQYCGIFYYYEPNSPYILRSHKTLVAPNKFLAYLHLVGRNIIISKFLDIVYRKLSYNPYREMLSYDNFDFTQSNDDLYALEDMLDQYLCNALADKRYDTCLLTTMQGRNRIVSEVLDVRERGISIQEIYLR